jgi:hypothetical protein
MIKYDKSYFNNIEKNRFVEMLNAEGIPASAGYDAPVYQNPLFLKKTLFNYNCPVDCPHYETEIDFKDFENKCPVAEKACKDEAVLLTQNMLLGDHKDMDSIVEAINKIKSHVN